MAADDRSDVELAPADASDFAVAKLDEEQRIIFGWAYVSRDADGEVVWDRSGEAVEKAEELEEAAYDFVLTSRVGGADHAGDAPNELVESIVFTPEKVAKMGLPPGLLPTGWWVGFHVADDELWKSVKNGERPAFSIEGSALREPVDPAEPTRTTKAVAGSYTRTTKAVAGSYEEFQETVRQALRAAVPNEGLWLRATFPDAVVYELSQEGQPDRTFRQPFAVGDDGAVQFGAAELVDLAEVVVPSEGAAA